MRPINRQFVGRLLAWLTILGWGLLLLLLSGPFKDTLNATPAGRSFAFLLVATTGLSMFGSWAAALSATSADTSPRHRAARSTLWKYPMISGVWFWLRFART
jgi:hypothetical protein